MLVRQVEIGEEEFLWSEPVARPNSKTEMTTSVQHIS